MGTIIEKKILSEYYNKLIAGEKTYELRLADWKKLELCNEVVMHLVFDAPIQRNGATLDSLARPDIPYSRILMSPSRRTELLCA